MDDVDHRWLKRCLELAEEALDTGNQPFGSVLVSGAGELLAEDHNRVAGGDQTQHPEFALARWAATHLEPQERRTATVYTSGEHCSMCAAAHAWAGLGPIVYASSSPQLTAWRAALGQDPSPVLPLRIPEVAPGISVRGPFPEYSEQVHALIIRTAQG